MLENPGGDAVPKSTDGNGMGEQLRKVSEKIPRARAVAFNIRNASPAPV
jgi:hypothetical protein